MPSPPRSSTSEWRVVGSTRRTATVAMTLPDSTSAWRSDSGLDIPPVPTSSRDANS